MRKKTEFKDDDDDSIFKTASIIFNKLLGTNVEVNPKLNYNMNLQNMKNHINSEFPIKHIYKRDTSIKNKENENNDITIENEDKWTPVFIIKNNQSYTEKNVSLFN